LRRFGQRARIPLFCYIALLPVLVLFFYVRIIPVVRTFVLSLFRWNMLSPRRPFVGLENYAQPMGDNNFLLALKNTTIYSFATVIFTTIIALPLAVFLSRKCRLSPFYQTVYFLPVITPLIPMSIAWKWIYDYNYGVLNYLLSLAGLPSVPWLTDPAIALWAIIVMTVWRQLGYAMVLYLVGLRNIPHEYAEAAAIDGAGDTQRFWRITLPLLRPIVLYVLVTSSISSFNVFAQVYVMTVGSQTAPGNALRVLVYDIYTNGFQFFHIGYASAEAVVLTMIVLGLTLIQFHTVRSDSAKEA
jgi:multiple sugar transport system permease protein